MPRFKVTPKRIPLVERAIIIFDDLEEYVSYLEERIQTQDEIIESLQRSLDAFGCFVRGLLIRH